MKYKVDTAIILAGGLGTRLRELVSDVPKPMALIKGRPFLEYLLDAWIDQGIEDFVISVGYKSEIIISHFGDKYRSARIKYAIELSPLGTGGGLLLAKEYIKNRDVFLILNGDSFFDVNLEHLYDFFYKKNASLCLSLFKTNEVNRYMNVEISPYGNITKIKSSENKFEHLANGGVYIIKNNLLEKFILNEKSTMSFENYIIPNLVHNNKSIFGMVYENDFIDIGLPKDYVRSSEILSNIGKLY